MTGLILSHSSIKSFLTCGYRWYLSAVLRLPGAQAVAPALGTAVHAGIEAHYKGQPTRAAFMVAWEREVASVPAAEVAVDPEAIPDGLRMIQTYIEKAAVPSPRLVEAPFLLRMDGVVLSGVIDLATEDVIDTKTRAGKTINGKKGAAFDPESHRLQLTLYALGYRSLTGQAPQRLLLDVLSRSGAYRQYEVEPDFGGLRAVVESVSTAIGRGEFKPTGALSGACFYCPYKNTCQFSTARETT